MFLYRTSHKNVLHLHEMISNGALFHYILGIAKRTDHINISCLYGQLLRVVTCKAHLLQESFPLSFVLYDEEYLWNRSLREKNLFPRFMHALLLLQKFRNNTYLISIH